MLTRENAFVVKEHPGTHFHRIYIFPTQFVHKFDVPYLQNFQGERHAAWRQGSTVTCEKPVYKEKLRLRSYGIPGADDKVYLELKKKYRDVVYKRRISLKLSEAEDYLLRGIRPKKDSQVLREIDYFIAFHKTVPKLYLAYDRIAWYGREDPDFRMTFDSHIRSRRNHLSLSFGDAADELFLRDYWLLEVKAAKAYPLWLVRLMEKLSLYPVSFSKYGTIYKKEVTAGIGRSLAFQKNMEFLEQ